MQLSLLDDFELLQILENLDIVTLTRMSLLSKRLYNLVHAIAVNSSAVCVHNNVDSENIHQVLILLCYTKVFYIHSERIYVIILN